MHLKRTSKFLNLGSTNGRLPALGLNIDGFESKAILLDNSVDPAISTSPDGPACIFLRSAVAHCDQHLNYQAFKES